VSKKILMANVSIGTRNYLWTSNTIRYGLNTFAEDWWFLDNKLIDPRFSFYVIVNY